MPTPIGYWNTQGTNVGYIMTSDRYSGSSPIYDCYDEQTRDYWTSLDDDKCTNDGIKGKNLRTLGWIWKQAGKQGTGPIYRCWNQDLKTHYVSKSDKCSQGGVVQQLLGYIYYDS